MRRIAFEPYVAMLAPDSGSPVGLLPSSRQGRSFPRRAWESPSVIEGGDRCERTGAGGWWDQVVAVLLGLTMLAVAPAEREMAHAAPLPPTPRSTWDPGVWTCSAAKRTREPSLAAHERIARLYGDVRVIGEKPVYPQLEKAGHFARQIAVRRLVGA
jgi:hypothetical protein